MTELKPQVWFPFYFKDFVADTARLSSAQRWDYIALLGHQWYQGHYRLEDIPNIVGLHSHVLESSPASLQLGFSQAVSAHLQPIIALLAVDEAGLYFSRRLDRELTKAIENRRSHAERGRKGGIEKQRRRMSEMSSSATSTALAGGVATGLAKSYPSPAPSQEEQKQKQLQKPSGDSLRSLAGGATEGTSPEPSRQPLDDRKHLSGPSPSPAIQRGREKVLQASQQHSHQGSPPSKNGAAADRRHATFKTEVFAYWLEQNPDDPDCPWTAGDGKALHDLLEASPKLQLDEFRRLLSMRARSEVNPSDLPRTWLRDLKKFSAGSLDRYGKLLKAGRQL